MTAAEDLLKYALAVGMAATSTAVGMLPGAVGQAAMRAALSRLLQTAYDDLAAVAADLDFEFYSGGYPVFSVAEWPDCACAFLWVWHPDPSHERNRAAELAALDCPRGGQHRVAAVARGELADVQPLGRAVAGG